MGSIVIAQMVKVLDGKTVPFILETPGTFVTKDNLDDYLPGNE